VLSEPGPRFPPLGENVGIDPTADDRYVLSVERRFGRNLRRFSRLSKPAELSSAEPGRYKPPCPHYPRCSGCALINVPYPDQLLRKREIAVRAFAAYPALAHFEVPPVVASPQRLGYRGRVKLVVRRSKGEIATGLYVPGSHHVVDISSCPIHPRPVNQVVQYLKKKIFELGIAPYDERDDSGDLRYLDFRYSFARRELSVTLVTRRASFPQGGTLARFLQRRFPFIVGVIQNINEQKGNVIWGKNFRTLAGRDTILERIGDLKLVYPAGVFSQANPFTARRLYERVCQLAQMQGGARVMDLYCGVGPTTLYLGAAAREVWGIDDSELAIATAKQNARRNGLGNCRFVAGDVAETLSEMAERLRGVDVLVLNPPRKGVQPAAMERIQAMAVPRVIYVSCSPQTQARDLDRLIQGGYRLRSLQPFDMFPQTEEVETVALLERD
jgi:23S rRNA (uracil1939-C5)-methyltransferase